MKLSQSQEDYLEAIYNEVQKSDSAKVTIISNILGVKKASVTAALNSLAEKGLINYSPYSAITLTTLGEKTAKTIIEKHNRLCNLFEEIFNLDPEEARSNACKIEHIISDELYKRVGTFLSFVEKNPAVKKQIKELY